MYDEVMMHFYKNFKLLENGTVHTEVRRVDVVLDVDLLREILRVHMNGFNMYARREWPSLGEEANDMYLTSKYTQGKEK